MKHLAFARGRTRFRLSSSRLGSTQILPIVDLLLITAFVVELISPILKQQGFLPTQIRWFTHAVIAAAMGVAYSHMMILGPIPAAVWIAVGVSIVGLTAALARGQGFTATLWGWWALFAYPVLGLYAYLRPQWPDRFSQRLTNVCLIILGLEVLVQAGQYLSGQTPGDHLAGTFARHGAAHLGFFSIFTLCLALGRWLVDREWAFLLFALVLGVVANVLAENKVFPIAALLLVLLASLLALLQSSRRRKVLQLWFLLGGAVLVFSLGYDTLLPGGQTRSFQERILGADYLSTDVDSSTRTRDLISFRVGRSAAMVRAWMGVESDPVTALFGFGLGARRQSQDLGTVGTVLREDKYTQGSGLVIMLQEMGLFGMLVIGAFVLWVSAVLYRDSRRYPKSEALGLRYAVLLFSLLWPVWLWYSEPLAVRAAMLLYWVALGYVLSEPRRMQSKGWSQAVPLVQ